MQDTQPPISEEENEIRPMKNRKGRKETKEARGPADNLFNGVD